VLEDSFEEGRGDCYTLTRLLTTGVALPTRERADGQLFSLLKVVGPSAGLPWLRQFVNGTVP
jgi:hypothetical protein